MLFPAAGWLSAIVFAFSTCSLGVAGEFDGPFEFRWLSTPGDKHREMKLLSEVSFTDDSGRVWPVPTDTDIDGASIPRIFWAFEGSPFVGNYRRASVIHDYFCTLTVATPSEVHWMFYEAMLADGVGWLEARRKHAAVSVYSWAGGSCAARVSSTLDLQSLPPTETFTITPELLAFTQRSEVLDFDPATSLEAAVAAKAIAAVKKPLTFDALAMFRLLPSEENYALLEQAIEREDTSAEEIRELASLVRAAMGDSDGSPDPIRQ